MKQQPIDGEAILREVAGRWQSSQTLEYRSIAILNHRGEYRVAAKMHVSLQRPNLARILIKAEPREYARLRVCDGLSIWDRTSGVSLRPATTTQQPFLDRVTGNIPHPLDETSYSADQFFSRQPFATPRAGQSAPAIAGEKLPQNKGFKLTLQWDPVTVDTLTIEAVSLRPLSLSRVANHGGIVQEILNEKFDFVQLGARIPANVFRWTASDDNGETLR